MGFCDPLHNPRLKTLRRRPIQGVKAAVFIVGLPPLSPSSPGGLFVTKCNTSLRCNRCQGLQSRRQSLLEDAGILIVSPEGPLESSDFAVLAREVDPYLEQKGQLNGLLIQAESFPGWHSFPKQILLP